MLNLAKHEIFPLINVEMPTIIIVAISTFISWKIEVKALLMFLIFFLYLRAFKISCSAESSMKKVI